MRAMTKQLCLFLLIVTCLVPAFTQEDKPIITVLDFTVDEVSEAEMRSIINVLSSSLFNTDLFTVIDVSQRDNVLKEMEFSMSGCSDESCMLEIGKMLSAEGIVIGSIGRVGSKYVLSAKMLETETAKTLSAADGIYQDLDELLEDISSLVSKLSRPYTGTAVVTEEPQKEAPGTVNIPAIATLAGGIAATGTGAYFLAVSLPLIFDYLNAGKAYEEGSAAAGDDLEALYDTWETAQQVATEGNANRNFILGASLAGAGIALSSVSIILFAQSSKDEGLEGTVVILPDPFVSTLRFSIRF